MRFPSGVRGRRAQHGDREFRILVVCTGNICRSPYVAARLAQRFPGVDVSSAGTAAVVGAPPHPHVVEALEAVGTPWRGTARQLRRRMIEDADLVLTMTGTHRIDVVRRAPKHAATTFTLKELASAATDLVATATGPASWADLIAHAQHLDVHAALTSDTDLDDPYGGPPDGYVQMATDADRAIGALARAVADTGPRP